MTRRGLWQAIALAIPLVTGGVALAAPGKPAAQAAGAAASHAAARANAGEAAARKPARTRARGALHGVVNLNDAGEDALERLPGVGPSRAKRIIEFRKAHPFKKVDDLARVRGIGRKTMARLKPFLAVTGATTLVESEQ